MIRKELFRGLLLGIGFSIPYFFVNFLYTEYINPYEPLIDSEKNKILISKNYGIKITDVNTGPFGEDDPAGVFGFVTNTTDRLISDVVIQAELYDNILDNKYMYSCSKELDGYLQPNQTRRFEMGCSGAVVKNTNIKTHIIGVYVHRAQ